MICSLWHEITLNKLTVLIRSVCQSESYKPNFVNFRRDYILHYKLEIVWPEIALDSAPPCGPKLQENFVFFTKLGFFHFLSHFQLSREKSDVNFVGLKEEKHNKIILS